MSRWYVNSGVRVSGRAEKMSVYVLLERVDLRWRVWMSESCSVDGVGRLLVAVVELWLWQWQCVDVEGWNE